MSGPKRTRTRQAHTLIQRRSSRLGVLMTKGTLGSGEAFPTRPLTHCPSPGVHRLHFARDPWLASDLRDGEDSRPGRHKTHAPIAPAPEFGKSRDGTSRWSHARQYESLRSYRPRGLNWGYFRIASLGTLQISWILARTN